MTEETKKKSEFFIIHNHNGEIKLSRSQPRERVVELIKSGEFKKVTSFNGETFTLPEGGIIVAIGAVAAYEAPKE